MSSIRKKWRERNLPINGYYTCWLCKKDVPASSLSLDHVLPVSEYPEYARNLSNLKPAHKWCNQERHAKMLDKLRRRKIIGIK